MTAIRILVTGSRQWLHTRSIRTALDQLLDQHGAVTLVHGACTRGADAIANSWALRRRDEGHTVTVEAHPANWSEFGRRAGMVRNSAMVKLGADVTLAFWRDGSVGTRGCFQASDRAGIDTRIYRWDDRESGRWVRTAVALGLVADHG